MAATLLRIVWDGDVPGLSERRLSLAAFEPALRELLSAVRRIATDLERDAWPTELVSRAGRLRKEAQDLDVQISTITANSPVTVECAVVELKAPPHPLIADLGERAVSRFLDDLKSEAGGSPAHYRVRKFLQALPGGLTKQKYVQRRVDGEIIREVDLGHVTIPEPLTSAHLIEVEGELVGVGFEAGRTEVKLRASSGELLTFSATTEEVEKALSLRNQSVSVLAVAETSRTRLLRLSVERRSRTTPEIRTKYLLDRWRGTLSRLAK